jgi:hypothetical protein
MAVLHFTGVGEVMAKRKKVNQEEGLEIIKGPALTAEIIAANPERYRTLSNGAIYDNAAGHIVKAPPPEMRVFSDQNQAKAAALSRHVAAQEAALQGLANAAGNIGVGTSESALLAWSNIVAAQARLAMDTEAGRASTEAARFAGTAAGLLRDRNDPAQPGEAGSAGGRIPGETLRALLGDMLLLRAQLTGDGMAGPGGAGPGGAGPGAGAGGAGDGDVIDG